MAASKQDRATSFSDRESAMTEKAAKPATKRVSVRKPRARRRKPSHDEISMRAYFLSLEAPGSDELGNWLRAERELKAA
jgi:hypothetical protein